MTTDTASQFTVGDLVRFATTAATVAHGVCFHHGTIHAVHDDEPDGIPRYDVQLTFENVLWQRVAPIHLMKDPIHEV